MERLVIMTVGKTHSGKTTFAKKLEQKLKHSIIIDQDNHAEFINTYYTELRPKEGPNLLKYAVSKAIVDYAADQTAFHLILCNSNRNRQERLVLLDRFSKKGFKSVLVHFNLPVQILQKRVAESGRNLNILRHASSFEQVLLRQQTEQVQDPSEEEADYLFIINDNKEIPLVIQNILAISE